MPLTHGSLHLVRGRDPVERQNTSREPRSGCEAYAPRRPHPQNHPHPSAARVATHAPEFFHANYHIRVSCASLNPVAARVPGHLYGLGEEDDDNLGTPTAGQQSGYRILARQLCARGGTETPRAVTRFRGDHIRSRTRNAGPAGNDSAERPVGARRTSPNSQSEGRVACHASGFRRHPNRHLIDSARQCCTPATFSPSF
jgi:hypothetical protein